MNLFDMMSGKNKIFNWTIPPHIFNILEKKRKQSKIKIKINDWLFKYILLSKRGYDNHDLFLIYTKDNWWASTSKNFGINKYSQIEIDNELCFLLKISARL